MPRILCDENIPKDLITLLRANFEHVGSIRELYSGISDDQVFELLNASYDCLITMDKDFGELLFNKGCETQDTSIILLRDPTYETYIQSIIQAISVILPNQLIILTAHKERVVSLS